MHENKIGKNVQVKWYDACQTTISKELLDNIVDDKQFLCIKTTYGKLLHSSENIIIILHEEDNDETDKEYDCTCIPASWIISVEELKTKNKKEIKVNGRKARNKTKH